MPRVLPYEKLIGGRTVYGFEAECESASERDEAMARVLDGAAPPPLASVPAAAIHADEPEREPRPPGRPSSAAMLAEAVDALGNQLDDCESDTAIARVVHDYLESR